MAVSVSHATQATLPNDPTKEISSDAWNEGHAVTGLGDSAELNVGTTAGTVAAGDHAHAGVYEPAGVSAADITDSTATGRGVLTAADQAAARTAIGAGTSSFDGAYGSLSGTPLTFAPSAHATSHNAGGGDALTGLVPTGGTTGQVLKKASNTNFDYAWDTDETTAGGGVDTANSPNANEYARFTDADTIEGRTASEARTDLGLVIGTNVQAHSAVLDATTASFTSADETKLDGIAAGATVGATWGSNITSQPAVVDQAEAEAGSATTERIWTAQRVAQAIAALGGGGGITSIAMQSFVADGTYTPTSGMAYCIVILTGSGAGGGGADSSTTTNDIGVGGGGGAGATRIGLFDAAAIGASKDIVIPAGGAAGSATNGTNGGSPADATFGSTLLVAPGGDGGIGSGVATEVLDAVAGGAGGTSGSGGLFGVAGGDGSQGFAWIVDGTVGDGSQGIGGCGGASFWGGGGQGGNVTSTTIGVSATSAGLGGKAAGSGGGGGVCSDTQAGVAGGAGVAGLCWIIEFIA